MKNLSRILVLAIVLIFAFTGLAFAADIPATEQATEGDAVIVEAVAPPAPVLPEEQQDPNKANIPPPADLTQLFIAIITLVSIVLTTFVAPWLKSSKNEKQLRKMLDVADTAARAAWDYLKSHSGEERLQYALRVMNQNGYTADMPGVLDALKAAWVNLKIQLNAAGINTDGTDKIPGTILTAELDTTADPQLLADAFARALVNSHDPTKPTP